MARGFESKDVEFQQDEAERRRTARRVASHDGARSFPPPLAHPQTRATARFAEAQRREGGHGRDALSQTERDDKLKRREIELSLRRVRVELETAAHPAHRRMLERAIEDLERRLTSDDGRP